MGENRRSFVFAMVWLLTGPVLLFVPVWAQGNVFGTFDLGHITIAMEDLFARYQQRGEIPVWAPEFHGGFPLMANAFQSFFYLPHAILRALLPGVWTVNMSLLLHLWLASVGMYGWLASYRLPRAAAVAGGLVFAMGGYFVGRITLPHLFFPAAWIPLVMWTLAAAWREPAWRRVGLASAAAAGLVFAGHMQMAVYAGLMGLIVLAGEITATAPRDWPRRWKLLTIPLILFGLTAVHTLPAVELIGQSRRAAQLEGEEAFDVSYPARHLLTWLKPGIFGHQEQYRGAKNEPELMTYFGIMGLVLGGMGLIRPRTWREPLGRAAIALVMVGFALAGGEYSPIFRFLHEHVWLVARFANPGRAIVLVHVGWSLLAALGAAAIFSRWRWRYIAPAGQFLLAIVVIELLLAARPVNPHQVAAVWAEPRVISHLPAATDAPRVFTHTVLELVPRDNFSPEVGPLVTSRQELRQGITPQRDNWQAIDVDLSWNGQPALPGSVSLLVEAEGRVVRTVILQGEEIQGGATRFEFEPITDSAGKQFTIILTSTYAAPQAPRLTIRTHRGESEFNPTGELSLCQNGMCKALMAADWTRPADASVFLRYGDGEVWLSRELLLPMFGEAEGQRMVRPHISLQIGRVDAYLRALGLRADYDSGRLLSARDLYDRFSIGTIIASFEEHRRFTGMPEVDLVERLPAGEREIHIFRNRQAYGRVHVARELIPAPEAEAALQTLVAGIPREAVVVEGMSGLAVPADLGQQQATIKVIKDKPREMQLETKSDSSQFLVVRDVYLTGWQAWVDGEAVPVYYTDSLFRGVIIPSGEHTVRFVYRPLAWRLGWPVSGAAWLGVLAGLYWSRLRRVSRP